MRTAKAAILPTFGDQSGVNAVATRKQDQLEPRWKPGRPSPWKYPTVVLLGADSVVSFYSVALTNNRQQADTGTR